MSDNDTTDNEMLPGAVHRSPGRRKPRKTLTRRQSEEGCATSHRLKWVPLPPNEFGTIAKYVMEGEGRKWLGRV